MKLEKLELDLQERGINICGYLRQPIRYSPTGVMRGTCALDKHPCSNSLRAINHEQKYKCKRDKL